MNPIHVMRGANRKKRVDEECSSMEGVPGRTAVSPSRVWLKSGLGVATVREPLQRDLQAGASNRDATGTSPIQID